MVHTGNLSYADGSRKIPSLKLAQTTHKILPFGPSNPTPRHTPQKKKYSRIKACAQIFTTALTVGVKLVTTEMSNN